MNPCVVVSERDRFSHSEIKALQSYEKQMTLKLVEAE